RDDAALPSTLEVADEARAAPIEHPLADHGLQHREHEEPEQQVGATHGLQLPRGHSSVTWRPPGRSRIDAAGDGQYYPPPRRARMRTAFGSLIAILVLAGGTPARAHLASGTVTLDVAEEVPPPTGASPNAGGTATFELEDDQTLTYQATVHDLTGP